MTEQSRVLCSRVGWGEQVWSDLRHSARATQTARRANPANHQTFCVPCGVIVSHWQARRCCTFRSRLRGLGTATHLGQTSAAHSLSADRLSSQQGPTPSRYRSYILDNLTATDQALEKSLRARTAHPHRRIMSPASQRRPARGSPVPFLLRRGSPGLSGLFHFLGLGRPGTPSESPFKLSPAVPAVPGPRSRPVRGRVAAPPAPPAPHSLQPGARSLDRERN
ncbi:hypothetical protein DAEQUDRAFT_92184 [Daedalea quercina L-15889]|uniref:Uncharacterized protein n=1 Tax=Daedalea quercina L-15889 TaxID=1314783 RepID=A0A165S8S8_9APHY|nr:hypothetical protein DAEQUDRAFT_92184 [Daedalea quercina L-15889]